MHRYRRTRDVGGRDADDRQALPGPDGNFFTPLTRRQICNATGLGLSPALNFQLTCPREPGVVTLTGQGSPQ